MRVFLIACLFLCSTAIAALAQEKGKCSFRFRVDAQSSALNSLIEDASARGGFWRPIAEAPDDVQEIGKFIGRLAVCMRTPDDRPRTFVGANGVSHEIASPFISWCTAALLPGNRLITNRHCYYNPQLADIGFTVVDKVQINFGYTSQDFTGNVRTFSVASREQAQNAALDAMVLSVVGADANAILGGHVPMVMETQATPRRALTMIHHPNGEPLQFSAGTCQIDPRQAELPAEASVLRHRCETAPGSSGSLLLDARSLAVVGLHNAGGLETNATYNTGHKIERIEAALQLGFKPVGAPPPPPEPERIVPDSGFVALAAALQLSEVSERKIALERIVSMYPGTDAARGAAAALASLAPPASHSDDTGFDIDDDMPLDNNNGATHNAFGLTLAALTPSLRQSYQVDASLNGLVVLAVDQNSSGAEKGFAVGDVISEVSQQGVTSFAQLQQRAEDALQAGRSSILLLVYRGSQPLFRAMPLSALEADPDSGNEATDGRSTDFFGLTLAEETPALREAYGITVRLRGLIVLKVRPDSPATAFGIEAGDFLWSADGESVRSIKDLTDAARRVSIRGEEEIVLGFYFDNGRQRDRFRMAMVETIPDFAPVDTNNVLGMSLRPLTPELRARYNIPIIVTNGAVVIDVDRRSEAYRRGVRPGGVIVRAGLDVVTGPESFASSYENVLRERTRIFHLSVMNLNGFASTWVVLSADPDDPL